MQKSLVMGLPSFIKGSGGILALSSRVIPKTKKLRKTNQIKCITAE